MSVLVSRLRSFITRLPVRFQWTLHNLIAHPVSEVLFQLGRDDLAATFHEATEPYSREETVQQDSIRDQLKQFCDELEAGAEDVAVFEARLKAGNEYAAAKASAIAQKLADSLEQILAEGEDCTCPECTADLSTRGN